MPKVKRQRRYLLAAGLFFAAVCLGLWWVVVGHNSDSTNNDWTRLAAAAPFASRQQAMLLNGERSRIGLSLEFWLRGDTLPVDTTGLAFSEHPCGMTVTETVRSIAQRSPASEPELVLELDSVGREIRRWAVPVDAEIIGVQGEELLMPLWLPGSQSVSLAVMPSGAFRVLPIMPDDPRVMFECPAIREFAGSGFLACWKLSDARTREPRRLAYQMPCT
jgi:hypothetical protein